MSQITINIGQLPNDGQGAPIRTAFDIVNKNFANVYGTGLVGSNLTIQNNSILSTNVNGEIRLVPNGVGNVVSNAHIIPNAANIRNLGTSGRRWRSVYTQYLDTVNQNVWGNLVVAGNLAVTGNIVTANVATLDIANLTITLAAGATSPGLADGAGILVDGANANMTYSAASNTFNYNIGIGVDGTVQALYYIGDGGGLSNINVAIDSSELVGNTLANTIVFSSLTTVGTLANLLVAGNVQTSGVFIGNGAGLTGVVANNITGTVANAAYSVLAQNAFAANTATQAVFATTSNYALGAGKADYANRASTAANAVYANTAFVACTADIANLAILASNSLYSNTSLTAVTVTANAQPNITSVGTLSNLSVTGNIVTVAGIYTDNYFFANGAPFSGGGNGGGTNYSNANVAAFLPTYSGNLGAISVTGISSNNYLWANGQPFTGNYGNAQVIALMASGNVPFISTANVLTTSLTVTGFSSLTRLNVTGNTSLDGNTTIGNIFTDGYYYANGAPLIVTTQGVVIGDQQIVPDGVSVSYALSNTATTNSIMVAVNGLTQTPGSSYTVVGSNIVFTSVPTPTDLIDIRFLGIGNGGGGGGNVGNYGNANVVSLLSSGLPGNIIPAGNAVYSLGNATNQWRSLYVSGNTIFLDNIPLSVTSSGSRLNWNGANVVVSSGTGGNIVTAGNVTANYYFGNARFMTGLPPQYTDANVSIFLASGTNTGNIRTVANISGNYILGNGAFLTGTYANSNVAGYLPTYTGNLTSLLGPVVTQANVTGQFIFGNARFMTGLPGGYGNSNVSSYLASGTNTGNIVTTANIAGNYILGNGALLSGTYSNAAVSAYLAGGLNTANIITQANVTGQFILGNARFMTGLPVSYGNANVAQFLPTYTGNLASMTGNLTTTANVQAGFLLGNGRFLTGVVSSYGNANVAGYLPTYTGVVGASTVTATGVVTAAGNVVAGGNIQGTYVLGDARFTTGLAAVAYTNNYNSLANLPIIPTNTTQLINGNGFITVLQANVISVNGQTGVVTVPVYTDANVAAYLPTYTGNISAGNVTVANSLVSNSVTATTVRGGNITLSGNTVTSTGNSVVIASNVVITGNLEIQGNSTIIDSNVVTINDKVFVIANNSTTGSMANGSGIQVADANFASMLYSNTANAWVFSIPLSGDGRYLANIAGANVTGTVANANYTLFSNTSLFANIVTDNAQPNITSLGTLVNLVVTGNVTSSGNIAALNLDITGDITGNNVITGDVVSANVFTGNILSDNYYYANGAPVPFGGGIRGDQQFAGNGGATYPLSQVTTDSTALVSVNGLTQVPGVAYNIAGNVITFASPLIASDSVDVRFVSNATITGSLIYNDANVAVYLPTYTGAMTSMLGNVTTTANISGDYILGNGRFLTGIGAAYTDANVIQLLGNLSSNIVSTANITGSYIIGNGVALANITGANVNGTVANANYSLFSNSSVFANTVTDNAQPNVTAVGTLVNLTVTGNVASSANISGVYIIGNGVALANITGANVNGTVANANYSLFSNTSVFANTVTDNAQPNITAVGTLVNLTVTGTVTSSANINGANINGGNITATGVVESTGNITSAANISAAFYSGNGRFLTGVVSSYGDANVAAYLPTYTGNLASMAGNIVTLGNITGNYLFGNIALATGANSLYSNANVAAYLPTYSGSLGGTLTTASQTAITSVGQLINLSVAGQTLSNTLVTIGNANVGTNLNTINVRATGVVTSPNLVSKGADQVATGVPVSLNNLRAVVPVAGNRSLQVSTVNGAAITLVGSEQAVTAGVAAASGISQAVAGTPVYLNAGRTLTATGDLQICNVIDTTAGVGYRITLVIGASTLNQITIEQLY